MARSRRTVTQFKHEHGCGKHRSRDSFPDHCPGEARPSGADGRGDPRARIPWRRSRALGPVGREGAGRHAHGRRAARNRRLRASRELSIAPPVESPKFTKESSSRDGVASGPIACRLRPASGTSPATIAARRRNSIRSRFRSTHRRSLGALKPRLPFVRCSWVRHRRGTAHLLSGSAR